MKNNIFIQEGRTINTLHPSVNVRAIIFSDEQRQMINLLLHHNFYPHHSSVGRGRSSKMCHCCGSIKKDLKLSDRTYRCACGYVEDRDFNASLNLRDAETYEVA